MNILHLRYVIEVDRTRSVSKAAENLFMNQSNLSRSIRELEQSLGVTLFKRTSKGMTPTPQGEEFLARAKEIVAKVDEVESLYKNGGGGKTRFTLSAPRADYISAAVADLASELAGDSIEICYKETGALDTVSDLLQGDFRLGLIRYQKQFDGYFKALLHEKDILFEPIAVHGCKLLLSAKDPRAKIGVVSADDLARYTQVGYPDGFVPSLPLTDAIKAESAEEVFRHIYVHDRAALLEMLAKVPKTFAYSPAIAEEQLNRFGLVQLPLAEEERVYTDLLIYRKGYHFTPYDRRFVELLHTHKGMAMSDTKA